MQAFASLLIFSLFMSSLPSCKPKTVSELKLYERDSGDICENMKSEATQAAIDEPAQLNTIYQRVYERELRLSGELMGVLSRCRANTDDRVNPKSECDEFKRNTALSKGITRNFEDLNQSCPKALTTPVSPSLGTDLIVSEEDLDELDKELEDPLLQQNAELLDTSKKETVKKLNAKISTKLKKYCALAGKALRVGQRSKGVAKSKAMCGGALIENACGALVNHTTATVKEVALDGEFFVEPNKIYYKNQTKAIVSAFKGCLFAMGKKAAQTAVKEVAKEGSESVIKKAFSGAVLKFAKSSKTALKSVRTAKKLLKFKAELCGFAGRRFGKKIETIPYEEWSSEQSCLAAGPDLKQRFAHCMQAAGHFCHRFAGNVNLDKTLGKFSNSELEEITKAGGEIGISTAAVSAPPLSIALTAFVDEITIGLRSWKGDGSATNPFLECTNIGPATRCAIAKFEAWRLGFQPEDLKTPIETWKVQTFPTKNDNSVTSEDKDTLETQSTERASSYYTRNICWCKRQCYIDDYGFDTEFKSTINIRSVVSDGEAGERVCQQRAGKFYGGLKKNGYSTYAYNHDCRVYPARVYAPNPSIPYESSGANPETWEVYYQKKGESGKQWSSVFFPAINIVRDSDSQKRTRLSEGSLNPLYPSCR